MINIVFFQQLLQHELLKEMECFEQDFAYVKWCRELSDELGCWFESCPLTVHVHSWAS